MSTHAVSEVGAQWKLFALDSDRASNPNEADRAAADAAIRPMECAGPCTVASALALHDAPALEPTLDAHDWWFFTEFAPGELQSGRSVLVFDGLASLVDVWLNDVWLGCADNMFTTWEADVSELLTACNRLVLRARAMTPRLAPRRPRARWRARLLPSQEWRWYRTSHIGRMPGVGPSTPIVGPWRPITLQQQSKLRVRGATVRGRLQASRHAVLDARKGESAATPSQRFGTIDVSLDLAVDRTIDRALDGMLDRARQLAGAVSDASAEPVAIASATLHCGGVHTAMLRTMHADGVTLRATLADIPCIAWAPHTHRAYSPLRESIEERDSADCSSSTPGRAQAATYDITVEIRFDDGDGATVALGATGFRSVHIDTADDAFAVRINGRQMFLRGTCWTPRDWTRVDLAEQELDVEMQLLCDAGINCIRFPGCFTYPTERLLAACDRAGILVWQDLMFSVLDYPASDEQFASACEAEVRQVLSGMQHHPSLFVVCGNAEVAQQATMSGIPSADAMHSLFRERLAAVTRAVLPGTLYWPSTPWGGALPFSPRDGTAHYFGVGAYRRALSDVRDAGVRFTTECLAFAHIPEPESPAHLSSVSDEEWKAGVPRDGGAGWDFEDVRDHYVERLFGADVTALRITAFCRYLQLGRAASAIVVERTMQEFRRADSPCGGALTWLWADARPGAGWGLVDHAGRKKSSWYAFRRASRPIALALTNDGMNGATVHLWNDGAHPIDGTVVIRLLREGRTEIDSAERVVSVPAHGNATISCDDIFGRFTDIAHAYRFGPPTHDVVHAVWCLRAADGLATVRMDWYRGRRVIDEAVLFPFGDSPAQSVTGLYASVERSGPNDRLLTLSASGLATHVRVGSEAWEPDDSWFHLVPGVSRTIRLNRRPDGPAADAGGSVISIEALNDATAIAVGD